MTEERCQYMRVGGRGGGRATVPRHGTAHMARIGKLGFAATKERHGGELLALLLGASYLAKYGRPIDLTTARNLVAERERAATRRDWPNPGKCACCHGPGQERHHLAGLGGGHGEGVILWLCRLCHARTHRELREERTSAREEHQRRAG